MSTIQNLKNFIRHGKQARQSNAPHGDPTTNVSPVHAQQQRYHAPQQNHYGISDPNLLEHKPLQAGHVPAGDYSAANVDHRNVAAQAGGVAARAAGDHQKMGNGGSVERKKDYDPSVIERIVAEERESQGKLPRYPGLERYRLVEKMGDGAFSNVYRAKDTSGEFDEVAIKVVRKFEMNSTQVCTDHYARKVFPCIFGSCAFPCADLYAFAGGIHLWGNFYQPRVVLGRQPSTSGFQEAAKGRGGAH